MLDKLYLPLPLLPQELLVQHLLTLPHLLLHSLHTSILQPKHMCPRIFACLFKWFHFEHIECIYQHFLFSTIVWELVDMGEPIVKHALQTFHRHMNCHLQISAKLWQNRWVEGGGEKALCFDVGAHIQHQLLHFLLIDWAPPEQPDGSVFLFVLFVLEDCPLMSVIEELDAPEHMIER